MSQPPTQTPLILALSGVSSSGKTTLARLLTSIFPSTILIHQDDFYFPEDQLPVRASFRDWDCAAAIDVPALVETLTHVRKHGHLPDWLPASKESQNSTGDGAGIGNGEEVVRYWRGVVGGWIEEGGGRGMGEGGREEKQKEKQKQKEPETPNPPESNNPRSRTLVIVDGFLLLGTSVPTLRASFDIRLLLRATYAKAKARRERRSGYVTLEGFWEDPPGYVDNVVWPGYVEEHAFLFTGGDVEGEVDEGVARGLGVDVCPGKGEWGVEDCLGWVVGRVMKGLLREDGD